MENKISSTAFGLPKNAKGGQEDSHPSCVRTKMAVCPYCDKELESLECWESGAEVFQFIEHPGRTGKGYCEYLEFKEDDARQFKCPGCKKTLFLDEAEALSFLTLKVDDACEFCSRDKGTEPIYDELEKREVWICCSCDSKIEWLPASSCSSSKTERRCD